MQDVITKLKPDLFLTVTGLTVADFYMLVRLQVFNTEHMNQAVFAFRRYEDASLSYSGLDSHTRLTKIGLYDTVVGKVKAENRSALLDVRNGIKAHWDDGPAEKALRILDGITQSQKAKGDILRGSDMVRMVDATELSGDLMAAIAILVQSEFAR